MTSSRARVLAIAALLVIALGNLSACATFGVRFETFNERLAGGYAAVTFVRELTGDLLENGNITADQADDVQRQADHLRAALDLARDLFAGGDAAADDKLALTLEALTKLADYLRGLQ